MHAFHAVVMVISDWFLLITGVFFPLNDMIKMNTLFCTVRLICMDLPVYVCGQLVFCQWS